jgi:glycosyltransferase involved in cell wall biosynthesis
MGRKRVTIGLVYRPTENWIGGGYYVQNIVKALSQCEDERLPQIKVYCDNPKDFEELQNVTHYPYLKMRLIQKDKGNHGIWYRRIKRYSKRFLGITFPDANMFPQKIECDKFVYPITNLSEVLDIRKALGWIPDFQEKYLKELFSEEELRYRNDQQKNYIEHNVPIVFSSEDARNDFYRFHPDGKSLRTFVLSFAVSHPDFSKEDIVQLKQRFGIVKPYLLCANQFWMHKNHLFLFKAFHAAIEKGLNMQLVCTGKLSDYRNNDYCQTLLSYIKDNNLEKDIIIVGFVERTEQLCLMDNSYAVIQPSLFEGWSTVVEDAKCLNKFIFLSNLKVHVEQNPRNVSYFNPNDQEDLVGKLLNVVPTINPYDYQQNIKMFGDKFIEIINSF